MIRAYIECPVGNDTDAIGEAFQFSVLPREGETISISYPEYSHEVLVTQIVHRVAGVGDVMEPVYAVVLKCEYINRVDN